MKKSYIATLVLLISFLSFADSKMRKSELIDIQETGKDLSTLIPEGTIIGDCVIRESKFYADKEYVIIVKKLNGNNIENAFQVINPSKYTSNDEFLIIKNTTKYKNLFSKTNRELKLKVVKLGNGTTKVVELFITSTSPGADEELVFNVSNSIGCMSKK